MLIDYPVSSIGELTRIVFYAKKALIRSYTTILSFSFELSVYDGGCSN